MAGVNKVDVRMRGMVTVAAAVLMVMAVVVVARPAKPKDSSCSTSDKYVYPFWSFCNSPAELSVGYHYTARTFVGGLEPEYDETNDTYYVRLGSSKATYVAVTTESTYSGPLLVNSTVYIFNAESQRALTWREEGTDEYFLIEQELVSSLSEAAPFRFLQAKDVIVPCPLIYPPAECHAYYLVSDLGASSASGRSGAGLQAYNEGSVTYIKAAAEGSTGDLPIYVTRTSSSSSSTTTSAMPFPTIRSVTARNE